MNNLKFNKKFMKYILSPEGDNFSLFDKEDIMMTTVVDNSHIER